MKPSMAKPFGSQVANKVYSRSSCISDRKFHHRNIKNITPKEKGITLRIQNLLENLL